MLNIFYHSQPRCGISRKWSGYEGCFSFHPCSSPTVVFYCGFNSHTIGYRAQPMSMRFSPLHYIQLDGLHLSHLDTTPHDMTSLLISSILTRTLALNIFSHPYNSSIAYNYFAVQMTGISYSKRERS